MLPPTPREIALAWLAIRLYPLNEDLTPRYPYSAVFTANVLELIVGEIIEISIFDCRTLLRRLSGLIRRERKTLIAEGHGDEAEDLARWPSDFVDSFRDVGDGCAVLDSLEHQIRDRVNEKHAEEDLADVIEPIERRSPLGLFLRRISLSLRRLDLAETALLARQTGAWCGHPSTAPPPGTHVADEYGSRREQAFKQYRTAMRENDFYLAKEALRRFNDYSIPTQTGQHHHALLNLAATLLEEEAYELAKETIDEAIRIARSHGDRSCLDHCIKVSKAIEQAQAVKKERERHEDDLPELPKIVTMSDLLTQGAAALPSVQSPVSTVPVQPIAEWHLEQARHWEKVGTSSLSDLHQDLAMEYANAEHDTYLDDLLFKAQRLVRHGDYDKALSLLIQLDSTRVDMKGYLRWADVINSILQKRDNHNDATTEHHTVKLPPSNSGDSFVSLARDVIETLHRGLAAPAAMEKAILEHELSRRDGRCAAYASARIVVAYCLIRMDMAPRAMELIESVWDTVQRIGDADTIALGEMVMAKITLEKAFKSAAPDYRESIAQITHATALAKQARWARLYEEGELFLYLIAQQQGQQRPRAVLPGCDDARDIWDIVELTGRKVMNLDLQL